MKVCFLLQRRFAYVGHDLAVHLKNRHGIEEFCGYVLTRPSYRFLISQKEINYSSLLLDEDLHLKVKNEKLDLRYIRLLEKEYGLPNLWPYIEVDRILRFNQLVREYPTNTPIYSHEELMLQIQVRAKAIIEMFEQQKPDVLVCSAIGGMGSLLLHNIAKKMGIRIVIIMPSKVGMRYAMSDNYYSLSEVDKEFDQIMTSGQRVENYQEAKKILEEFRNNPQTYATTIPFYFSRASKMKQLDFFMPGKVKKYLIWLFGRIKNFWSQPDKYDYSYVHTLPKIKDQFIRKIRAVRGVNDLFDKIDPDNEDFSFFPLHFEPEITLLLYAPRYTNQLEVISQVAKSLPIHFKLYVKEHPKMIGFRSRNFYKELKKIPNVKLVDPKVKSLELIPKSKLLTVITGSVGWEAVQLKIPVISFGGVFFNKFPSVKRCDSYEKLSDLVKYQLENFKHDEEAVINYIGLILKHSAELDLLHLWFKEPDAKKKREGLGVLADTLADYLKLHSS